jgi:hypothetical protein
MAADDDRPPLMRTWRGLYALVVGALVVEIIVFSLLTWWYR